MKDRPLTARRCGSLLGAIMCYIHHFQLIPSLANCCLCILSNTIPAKPAERITTSAKLRGAALNFLDTPLRSD